MNDLFIEFCDFREVPAGGQLSFAKNFLSAFGREAAYVGLAAEESDTLGVWVRNRFLKEERFFAVAFSGAYRAQSILPARVRATLNFIRHVRVLRREMWSRIFVQSPEGLFCALMLRRSRIEYRFAGANNPAAHSRYPLARLFSEVFWWIFCRALRKADRLFVTAGEADTAQLRRELRSRGVSAPLEFLPTLVDEEVFSFDEYVPRDRLRLIYVGRLNQGKRCDVLIRAFSEVRREYPDARLLIVGDGEVRESLVELCGRLKLDESVEFKGAQPQDVVAQAIRGSNVFVLASEREGWPTCLVEASSIGRFIVTTPVSGAREICGDHPRRGKVVPGYSDADLAGAIRAAWQHIKGGEWSPVPDRRYGARSLRRRLSQDD